MAANEEFEGISCSSVDDVEPEDRELFLVAKQCRSLANLQPLQTLCMKTVVKNFDTLSTSLEYSIPGPVKALFLEFLLQQTKQRKDLPLSQDERLAFVKLLLNPKVTKFDFDVLGSPSELPDPEGLTDDDYLWDDCFDDMWTELAAKCPDLTFVREMRPRSIWSDNDTPLNAKVFTFSQLTCLETSCTITTGSLAGICKKLKKLQRLQAWYKLGTLTNVWGLCWLEHLQELVLAHYSGMEMVDVRVDNLFMANVHQLMPKLKMCMPCGDRSQFVVIPSLENLNPSALEECFVRLRTEEDISRLANFVPNLRHLEVDTFPTVWDPLLLRQLTNLNSLRIPYNQLAFEILASVGPKLKELHFMEVEFESPEYLMEKRFEKLLNVFMLCPELEFLEVYNLRGEVDLSVPVEIGDLKLKKLHLEDLSGVNGFLSLICRAPLLEEVELNVIGNFSKQDIETLNNLIPQGMMFQNLEKFTFCHIGSYDLRDVVKVVQALETMTKNIVSFSPKLQKVSIGDLYDLLEFASYSDDDMSNEPCSYSHLPFLHLLKIF